jgi:hypothetical protein
MMNHKVRPFVRGRLKVNQSPNIFIKTKLTSFTNEIKAKKS